MAHRYVKAPMYVGKSLVIQRGRRDKTVLDGEVLEGREWEKYVAHGLLVPDPNDVEEKAPEPKPKAKEAPPPPPEPEKVETVKAVKEDETKDETPPAEDEGSVSKSPASKVSGTGGKRRRKGKK